MQLSKTAEFNAPRTCPGRTRPEGIGTGAQAVNVPSAIVVKRWHHRKPRCPL